MADAVTFTDQGDQEKNDPDQEKDMIMGAAGGHFAHFGRNGRCHGSDG